MQETNEKENNLKKNSIIKNKFKKIKIENKILNFFWKEYKNFYHKVRQFLKKVWKNEINKLVPKQGPIFH